ncbi:DUF4177 domain-containing protein [Yoonia sp. R2331]|uniref:DUF4177 domain-containing protein n=1 Tax=Yoonia sp. R2331 TaxID=3237238 RepID=UPI0034E421AF
MSSYEYKVVPAPTKGLKAKGVKSVQDRFANALETVMNDLAADGWEYQRTDTLPAEEREGLMGKTTVFQNMLVFRRTVAAPAAAPQAAETVQDRVTETITADERPKQIAHQPAAVPAPVPRPDTSVAAE